jgi:hypothetical protein
MRVWVCLLLFAAGLAWANDTRVIAESGRVRRVRDKKTTVQMVRETVVIDVFPDAYTVTAVFRFRNTGPACTVTMGFPERGYGDVDGNAYRRRTGFATFATTVDGQPVAAQREPAFVDEGGMTYRTYWVKTVTFAKDQSRTVQVRYRAPISDVSTGEQFVTYDFTGGNWHGEVEESLLTVQLHLAGTYVLHPSVPMTRKDGTLTHRWTHWQAEEEFELTYSATRPDAWQVAHPDTRNDYEHFRDGVLLTLPGAPAEPRFLPPVIEKNGTLFFGLAALKSLLRETAARANVPQEQYPTLTWDEKANTATLKTGTHVLRIRPYAFVMHDGETAITLPAQPFRTRPGRNYMMPSALYVPAEAVVKHLGGTVTAHPATRTLELTLPRPAGTPPAKPKE